MCKAIWNKREIAAGDDVIEVENRLYFRPQDVRRERLRPAPERSLCEWKGGEAVYFDVVVDDQVNRAAAWSYARTGVRAQDLVGRIAFWRGIDVVWDGDAPQPQPRILEAVRPNVAKALGASAVIWRPILPVALCDPEKEFSGYLIPSIRILVDVIETPPEHQQADRIAAARAFGQKLLQWNKANPSEAYGYVAVWGSATPHLEVIAALRRHEVVVALSSPAEILTL